MTSQGPEQAFGTLGEPSEAWAFFGKLSGMVEQHTIPLPLLVEEAIGILASGNPLKLIQTHSKTMPKPSKT